MSISLPNEDRGKADVFVDDVISVCVDLEDNLPRLKTAPCTVIHAVAREKSENQVIPRDDMICNHKIDVEGATEEQKTCLGWLLDAKDY